MHTLILGGTGTLGREATRQLLEDGYDVTCFSRCELKQKELQNEFKRVNCIVGDIRDYDAVHSAMRDVDTVLHLAALKHVDVMEHNPDESIKTNILGTMNVIRACENRNVKNLVFSSTDKACEPVNAYGMSKALSEKLIFNHNRIHNPGIGSVYRWGNVIASRGSAIPHFVESLKKEGLARITDERMSRFFIRIEDACTFMLNTYKLAPQFEPTIPDIKATNMILLVDVLAEMLDIPYHIEFIGIRPGEKLDEKLTPEIVSSDEKLQMTREELQVLLEEFV